MVDTGAGAPSAAPRYPTRPGRTALWLLGAIAPVLCLVVAVPAMFLTYLLAYPLLYAGPVVGTAVIVGGALRRRRIRRELAAGGGLDVVAAGAAAASGAAAAAVAGSGVVATSGPGAAAVARPADGAVSVPGATAMTGPADGAVSVPCAAAVTGPGAVDRIPEWDDRSTPRSGARPVADAALVAREAAAFRLVRQPTLFLAYSAVAIVGIASLVTAILGDISLAWFSLSSFAFLGITISCVAPGWAFSRGVVVGEEHALLSRSGSWRLIRALRILSLVVGGVATVLAAYVAIALPLGGPWAFWLF
ncbi:hypothetical protein GCM10010988_18070 [Cnuibacter physcomitrellae]|uniref:Uncharacterized protein n=1 Tax=Cnuibacter physcomitrellae TaxID=1619308 RepID=A0A1X9LMY4_9MICO|nr:hypothetical protein [Cnuibacter physcomitrellae]ARJ06543.1 hypothetical protein B5808_15930 [Cnuibacter physcomitrellae]GGI38253.1 hypothetical protein GCM10010988_18070 [Cnuibacter physcomitrellae]